MCLNKMLYVSINMSNLHYICKYDYQSFDHHDRTITNILNNEYLKH